MIWLLNKSCGFPKEPPALTRTDLMLRVALDCVHYGMSLLPAELPHKWVERWFCPRPRSTLSEVREALAEVDAWVSGGHYPSKKTARRMEICADACAPGVYDEDRHFVFSAVVLSVHRLFRVILLPDFHTTTIADVALAVCHAVRHVEWSWFPDKTGHKKIADIVRQHFPKPPFTPIAHRRGTLERQNK